MTDELFGERGPLILAEIKIRVPKDHKTFGGKPITLLSVYQEPLLDEKIGDTILELLAEYPITTYIHTWFDGGLFTTDRDWPGGKRFFASISSDEGGMHVLTEYLVKTLTTKVGLGILLHTVGGVTGGRYALELDESGAANPAEIDFGGVWQVKEIEVIVPGKLNVEERSTIVPITDG